jgi:transposase
MRKHIELPIAEIVAKYEAGKSSLEIARQYGVHFNTIIGRLHKANVKMRSGGSYPRCRYGPHKKQWDVQVAILDYKQRGITQMAVAKLYNISHNTVNRTFHRMGVAPNRRGRLPIPIPEHVLEMFTQGKTMEEIGRVEGVTKQAISSRLKRHGITRLVTGGSK